MASATLYVADAEPTRRTESGGFYRPELDGLRFTAFLAVYFHHMLPHWPEFFTGMGMTEAAARGIASVVLAGSAGVDLFFCLSAYLITGLLLREREARGHVDVRAFWIRRALRIWPLYYAFVVLTLFVLPRLWPNVVPPVSGAVSLSFLLFYNNWACTILGYPLTPAALLWSVAIEEQFYLVWPVLLKLVSPRKLWGLFLGILVATPLVRLHLIGLERPHPGIYCNTLARLDPIALGGLLALALHGREIRLSRTVRLALVVIGIGGIVGLEHHAPVYVSPPPLALTWTYTGIAACAALLLVAGLTSRREGGGTLARRPIVYLGRISYGLYVFHHLALRLVGLAVGRYEPGGLPGPGAVVTWWIGGFALTLVFAAVSFHFLERPFLRLKARFARVASRPE
jgi:peptidoglycan/LPS O-acetylase OafA/YrhL